MRYILRMPLLLTCLVLAFLLGCFVGYDISNDFLTVYSTRIIQIPVRYILLCLIIFSNLLLFNQQNCLSIILRRKSFFNSIIYLSIYELIVIILIFLAFNFPVMIQNMLEFFNNITDIGLNYINCIIMSLFVISLIKMIDVIIKNRSLACSIFLIVFASLDYLLEHFNYFSFDKITFDFSYIFCLPCVYKGYYIIAIILLITTIVLNILSTFIRIKNDFMLESVYEEN